jgi:integrase
MIELIRHYERIKSLHQPLSRSLGEKLVQLRDAFGGLDANSDGTAIVKAATLYWPNVKANTMKRNLTQLKAVLRFAARTSLIQSVPHIEMPSVYDVRHVEVSVDELDMLLDHVAFTEAWAYPAVTLLAHTGARLGEAFSLHGDSFTDSGVKILKPVARRSKTVARVIPYTKRMRSLYDGGVFSGVIFRTKDSAVESYATEKSASAALHRVLSNACDALGLPHLRVHDLRHCFAAVIAEMGGDLSDIVSALGHTNTSTAMRYRGLVVERLRSIVERV